MLGKAHNTRGQVYRSGVFCGPRVNRYAMRIKHILTYVVTSHNREAVFSAVVHADWL
jgi:hypothetical protein